MGAVGVLATFVLAACGGGENSRSEGQQNLCATLKTLRSALTQVGDLDPKTASTADIEAAADQVRTARKQVDEAAKAVSFQEVDAVTLSATRLVTAVNHVPAGTSPNVELQQIQPALHASEDQFESVYNGLSCGTAP
jgi:hypothetical protein